MLKVTERTTRFMVARRFEFLQKQNFLILSIVFFILAMVYINPFHETAFSDDWAYSLMARHLYDTGQYTVHIWSSSNLMFQTYWGVLFASIEGFSLGALHSSTVVLIFFGIIAFYFLAQEHKLNSSQAGLVTLCLVSSPLMLYFSVTFMTDVPFLALLIISLLFLTKGLRLNNYFLMIAGSLAVVADMYIRPTGLALIAGLGCIWLVDRERWQRIPLYLSGLVLPAAGAFYLLFGGTLAQFQSGSFNGNGQITFLTDVPNLLNQVLVWRPAVFLQYLAFFSLPLTIVVLINVFTRVKSMLFDRRLVLGLILLQVAAMIYNAYSINRVTMPYLPWNLLPLVANRGLSLIVTLITLPGAIFYACIIIKRVLPVRGWLNLPLHERLLDTTTVFLLLYHLFFFNLGDRYLLVLLPFTLIVVGRHIQLELVQLAKVVVTTTLVVIVLCSIWTRDTLSEDEVMWQASEHIKNDLGVNPRYIISTWEWYSIYNIDAYVKETPINRSTDYFFSVWLVARNNEAQYHVVESLDLLPDTVPKEDWQVVETWPYRDGLYRQRSVLVVKRITP